jgi:uncharacterized protein (TIGR02996 family)
MTDDEARLLAALQADPEDDEARLVYADWLEERADPRGEYLRLEVQAHRLPPRLAELGRRLPAEWIASVGRRYRVVLYGSTANKIGAIKVVREITGLGLKGAKDLVDAACSGTPKILKAELDLISAQDLASRFETKLVRIEPGPFREGPPSSVQPIAPQGPRGTHPKYRCVLVAVASDRKLEAIKRVRELTLLGLLEARNLVEAVAAGTPATLDPGTTATRAADLAASFGGLGEVRLEVAA